MRKRSAGPTSQNVHGPLWDLAEDADSARLIETTLRSGKPVALVCHAPGVLRHRSTRTARRWCAANASPGSPTL